MARAHGAESDEASVAIYMSLAEAPTPVCCTVTRQDSDRKEGTSPVPAPPISNSRTRILISNPSYRIRLNIPGAFALPSLGPVLFMLRKCHACTPFAVTPCPGPAQAALSAHPAWPAPRARRSRRTGGDKCGGQGWRGSQQRDPKAGCSAKLAVPIHNPLRPGRIRFLGVEDGSGSP